MLNSSVLQMVAVCLDGIMERTVDKYLHYPNAAQLSVFGAYVIGWS